MTPLTTDLFYWLLNMSLTASGVGLVLLGLRRVRRLPSFAIYSLWSLVLLRLVVPFSVATRVSLLNLIASLTSRSVGVPGNSSPYTTVNYIMAASDYAPVLYKTPTLERVFETAAVVWGVGAVVVWVLLIGLYVLSRRSLRGAKPLGEGVFESDRVDTPLVVGVFRPRILVPAGIDPETLRWALLHERVHLRRRDNLGRAVALAVCGLHWFNPLVWIFLRAFLQDMESACDAGVLRGLPEAEKKAYARSLLAYATRGTVSPVPAFGGGNVRKRIGLLLSYRSYTLAALVGFVVLWVAIAIALLTNAAR